MTMENLLQIAKNGFRFYVDLAKDDPSGAFHWMACLNGIRHMALDAIYLSYENVSEGKIADMGDILDEEYDRARKEIENIYRMSL